jgi:hypothetical protein
MVVCVITRQGFSVMVAWAYEHVRTKRIKLEVTIATCYTAKFRNESRRASECGFALKLYELNAGFKHRLWKYDVAALGVSLIVDCFEKKR